MTATKTTAYTTEQAHAIQTRGVSIALSAGAGCGKTFVLTERFLDLFDPHDSDALRPEQLGQLIAITFTDRAAREMRDRIRSKCYDRLRTCDSEDEKAVRYWTSLMRFLDGARVSTIHSFCSSLLRSHAVEAQLDPQFGVLEQSEADTLLAELIDDTLRRLLAEQDADTIELLVRFSLDQVRTIVASLVGRRERTEYHTWIDATADDLLDAWTAFHNLEVPRAVLAGISSSRYASRLLALARDEVSQQQLMQDRCAVICEKLSRWRAIDEPTSVAAAVAELEELHEAAKIAGGKQWVSDEVKDAFGKAATELRNQIKRAKEYLAFDREAARSTAEFSLLALRLSAQVVDVYAQRKKEISRLDFDDLLTAAHRLLTDPAHQALQSQLSDQVRLLLVDEFQDTDPLQVELVKALCGDQLTDGKLFFVGDMKQSIYRFRGAKPQVFFDLQNAMSPQGRLPLSRNFRSQPAILQFVNALFVGELTEDYRPLVPHRPQVGPVPAVEFLWAIANASSEIELHQSHSNESSTPADAVSNGKENVADMREREAEWIARRLRSLLDDGELLVYDAQTANSGKPTARPARPGDVAVLFRALSDVELYEKALQRYDIPYYLVGGHAFYAQQEIYDLVNLLQSIASPADAISLAGALRSPFFSLADETLFQLSQHSRGLAEGLFADVRIAHVDEARKVAFARRTIESLRAVKNCVPVAELIGRALDLTGYDAALLCEFLGERKLANLNKLIDQARAFDRSGLFTLDDFIEQLSRFVAKEPKEPFAAIHPEAGDVVRLMSIHMSKGLEFPIVVVPDMERSSPGGRDLVEYSSTLGPMVRLPELPGEGGRVIGGLELYSIVAREEDEQELRRLLYVATTRAADYLLLSSSVKELGKPNSTWTDLLARHFDLTTGDLIADLPTGWGLPTIKVTSEQPKLTTRPHDSRSRTDLAKLVAEVELLAADGKGQLPSNIGPLSANASTRRQFSFSRLTGQLKSDVPEDAASAEIEFVLPAPVLDPLGLGTLVHAALAEIDFVSHAGGQLQTDVRAIVDRHADRHIEEPQGEIEEAVAMIERLLAAPISQRLAAATKSFTELEFLLNWPPGDSLVGCPYLRGFIDRIWQDNMGNWHIVDFKTNHVSQGNIDSTAKKYEMQMLVYALAVEQIFGRAPVSLTLHFLRTGDDYPFDWNLAARESVVKMISSAIDDARRGSISRSFRSREIATQFLAPSHRMNSLDPEAQRNFAVETVKQLRSAGFQALWAGGCVRDQLLSRNPKDYDVATDATPEAIRNLFGKRRTIPVGAAFGVITVLGPTKSAGHIEVATFRQDDTYSDGRRPDSVTFSTPEKDALRRDFTINGLFFDPLSKTVIDYVGGQEDLKGRIVRAIGNPEERFAEDKLRLLRAVRFAATLNFALDPETQAAMQQMAPELAVVSIERIAAEMRSMLMNVNRARALMLLREVGLLKTVLPEVATSPANDFTDMLSEIERLEQPSFALALAVLLHRVVNHHGMAGVGTRWKLSNMDLSRAVWLIEHKSALCAAATQPWPVLQRLLIQPGIEDLLAMHAATQPHGAVDVGFCQEKLAMPKLSLNPPPLINGNDLQLHGIPPGKEYQRLLEAVRDAQLLGQISTKQDALALAANLLVKH